MMASLHRYKSFLLLLGFMMMATYNLFLYFFTAYPFNVPRNYVGDPIPTRRDVARKLMKIQREIEVRTELKEEIDVSWAKRLLVVASEIDPRVAGTGAYSSLLDSAPILRSSGMASKRSELRRICPDKYKGRDFDTDMRNNYETLPCRSQKFRDVLTVLIPAKGWEHQRIERILIDIRKYHTDIEIVVVTHGYIAKPLEGNNLTVKRFTTDKTESQAVNEVIQTVETPYTLIAHSLERFDVETSLERLVRVLEANPDVTVASGAYKDLKGFWHHGCLQATAENYQIEYVRGYEYSNSECMYCDDVLGPFIVRTEFLKKVFLTGSVEGSVVYRDWFLNVRLAGKLVMSCPDVMFYVKSEPSMSKTDWYKIAQKWSIENIMSYDKQSYSFSCDDAQISCKNLMKAVSSFLVPPCCRKVFREELEYVQKCAEEVGLHYELDAGSLLGAVKMDGMLPWDFDTDIITDCGDKEVWMSKGHECLTKKGCSLKTVLGNYWTATCNASIVDLKCQHNRTKKLTPEYVKTPTLIEFNDIPTRVPLNPGRYARNYFGEEYLKHAVHWRYSSNELFPMDDGSGQKPGLWSNCVVPTFHSCIDHFPVDGNIKFRKLSCRNP